MGKKQPDSHRTDAERRIRQSERLSRLLRVLHCIMGPGRWDADALARELEVSPRTIHRLMQTLSMANVPWYFCKQTGSYRVRQGFRFPGIDGSGPVEAIRKPEAMVAAIDGVLAELGRFTEALKGYREELAGLDKASPPAEG
jgi:hypothetical protein